MCGGVAARLSEDTFFTRFMEMRETLGPKHFATMMCGGVAARLLDDAFVAKFHEWRETLGSAHFATVMCNGVAARLCNENFDMVAKKWLAVLGAKDFARIFGISGFVNRIVIPEWALRFEQVYLRERDGLYPFLRRNRGKKLDCI
jgi:hypothetical protein